MANAKPSLPDRQLALYRAVVDAFPEIEMKGASMPYTSLNGHMFSFIKPDGEVALRLPADRLADFIADFATQGTIRHGREMKEYADVTTSLLEDTEALKSHFQCSIDYISSLKPKATKRKQ